MEVLIHCCLLIYRCLLLPDAVLLDRPTFQDGAIETPADLGKHIGDRGVEWAIDDEAECAVIIVIYQKADRVLEVVPAQGRHRDEELVPKTLFGSHRCCDPRSSSGIATSG